jgi:hypothetical protein
MSAASFSNELSCSLSGESTDSSGAAAAVVCDSMVEINVCELQICIFFPWQKLLLPNPSVVKLFS